MNYGVSGIVRAGAADGDWREGIITSIHHRGLYQCVASHRRPQKLGLFASFDPHFLQSVFCTLYFFVPSTDVLLSSFFRLAFFIFSSFSCDVCHVSRPWLMPAWFFNVANSLGAKRIKRKLIIFWLTFQKRNTSYQMSCVYTKRYFLFSFFFLASLARHYKTCVPF